MDCRRLGLLMVVGLVAGCTAPRAKPLITEEDPANKIPAISMAVQKKDLGAAKQLVTDLDSDDPAVRFYAIEGLRRLTGQTFDYLFYDDAVARKPAIGRWQEWLASQDKGK